MAQQRAIPIRRRDLALYALSDVGYLAAVFAVFFGLIPTTNWPGIVVGLVAGASVLPLLLKNLVPVVPTFAKRITNAGALLTFAVLFAATWVADLSMLALGLLALVPSILAGTLLVLVGARRS